MYMCTLHCLYSVLHCLYAAYAQHSRMVMLHMPICMFTSIMSPLTCSFPSRHHKSYYLLYKLDTTHDPMITGQVVKVLKDDMFLYFYCFLYAYYMVSPVQHHVLYILIMLVLLQFILLPPSFYHSLGRFLTTLGLHVQVGDPSYRSFRECLGVTWEIPHRDYSQVSQ